MRVSRLLIFSATLLCAQPDPLEGSLQGFDGEWSHVSGHLIALAQAIPPALYSWRPVRDCDRQVKF
jgi:hypothetical protein